MAASRRSTEDGPAAVLRRLDADENSALARLFEVLEIPSVSTDPARRDDCRRAAGWFADQLAGLGFEAAVRETPGQPATVATWRSGRPGAPHVVYYGHHDVQPPDPLDEWDGDPFEARMVDGPHGPQIVARGAVDDKGQVVAWIEAFRAHMAVHGTLPLDITVVIEGEEETGSLNFDHLLRNAAGQLEGAQIAIISDGNMWNRDTAAITTQLRGLVYLDLHVTTADRDLHSGLYGGAAGNAALALCAVLGRLRGADGRIAVPEVYEGVAEPSDAARAAWDKLGFDEAAFLAGVGLSRPSGEADRTALERLWSRPTVDVHGLWGGFAGEGSKTVIPARAGAKVSFRMAPGQDPRRAVEGFGRFVDANLPPDATAQIDVLEAAPALTMPEDSPWLADVAAALRDEMGRPAVRIGCGGSLGAAESFHRVLGIPTALFSFGLDDDRVHAPNEKFELGCFRHAARAHARLLDRWHAHGDGTAWAHLRGETA